MSSTAFDTSSDSVPSPNPNGSASPSGVLTARSSPHFESPSGKPYLLIHPAREQRQHAEGVSQHRRVHELRVNAVVHRFDFFPRRRVGFPLRELRLILFLHACIARRS